MRKDAVIINPPLAPRPFSDLRDTGLLWLINRAVLHPRGFAFQLHFNENGEAIGWALDGDGTEPWAFEHSWDHEPFAKVQELLKPTEVVG